MGSKRIPRKNVRLFHGVPAICLVVRKLVESGLVRGVFVSTDEKAFLEDVFAAAGLADAVTVLDRVRELASDHATSLDVLRDWVESAAIKSSEPVLLTYPTSVFLSLDQIKSALKVVSADSTKFVATVQQETSSERHLEITARGHARFRHPEHANTRTQDTTEVFRDAAQLYLATAKNWLVGAPFKSPTVPLKIDRHSSIDIDTEEDWLMAELIYKREN